jgi:signal transduction histidine kinase
MVTIFISDTGIGISEEHLSSVAQRFYRVDASRSKKAGGSGLGLSIVDASIRALRGIVAIESVVGFGTTVSFVFKKLLIHNP